MSQSYHACHFDISQFNQKGKYLCTVEFDKRYPEVGSLAVSILTGKEEGPLLLIFAGVHGDEYEGIEALLRLIQSLSPDSFRGKVVAVPVANPSAFMHISRNSAVDGRNLARTFPGKENGDYTERLAWLLHEKFIGHADFFLDLHSGGSEIALPPFVGYYDNEKDPVGQSSRMAAEQFGLPVIWGHAKIPPGRTISSANTFGVPWLYTEAYGGRRVKREERKMFSRGIKRLMHHLDMLLVDEPLTPISVHYDLRGNGDLDQSVRAETKGFFIPEVRLLDFVEEGDRIGGIYNCHGIEQESIHAVQQGIVVMLRETRMVSPGDPLYTLAEKKY